MPIYFVKYLHFSKVRLTFVESRLRGISRAIEYFFYLGGLQDAAHSNKLLIHGYIVMAPTENCILKGRQSGYVHIPKSPERALKNRVYSSGQYLLTRKRHIELNLVRTGMAEHTRAYYWTTYATNANAINRLLSMVCIDN